MRPDLPAELELLVAAGRLSLDRSRRTAPIATTAAVWDASVHAAQRHGMTAWLAEALRQCSPVPDAVRTQLATTRRTQAALALKGIADVAAIVTLLRGAGVETVNIKGPLYARWLYGDAGVRRFADVDLVITRNQRAQAIEALRVDGYRIAGGLSEANARVVYAGVGSWPLLHPTRTPIDLHWMLQAPRFGTPFTSEALLRDSSETMAAGTAVRIPSPTHAAVLALVHAAKHLWASLELLLSIAHLMRRDDVDWARVRGLITTGDGWTGAQAGLLLSSDLFECELPPALRGMPRPRSVERLQSAARTFLSVPDVDDMARGPEFRAHHAALDSWPGRLRYTAWRVLAPTPLEAAWCPLPGWLSPLYVVVRPVRLTLAGLRGVLTRIPALRARRRAPIVRDGSV